MQKGGKSMLRAAVLTALLLTFLFSQATAATLKLGAKDAAVYALQTNLQDKGYFNAKVITEKYTTALRKAVGVFQIANDIKPKAGYGVADDETQMRAASPDAVTYPQYVEKLTDAQLKPGGSGAYVKKAQTKLRSLGYYGGKIDSKYRSTTIKAVQDFQTANDLSTSGIADAETRAVLYSAGAKSRAVYDAENFLTPLSIRSKNTTQVTQLQQRLAALGYYWDEPTGVFDAQTKYSVKFFQEANGFSASGTASRSVRALVNKDTAKSFDQYVTDAMKRQQLSPGCKGGVRVAVLQLQLSDKELADGKRGLGYYKGAITGLYSGSVATAVRTFQMFNNMNSKYVTGKANTATREKLLDANAISYETVCGSNTLKSGSGDSDAVKRLQTKLKGLGYYTGSVDGVYDGAVASAVKMFQRYNGLYPTGIAYSNTLSALESDSVVSYTNAHVEKFIEIAMSKLGKDYVWGTQGPNTFDCSGFTYYCLKRMGITVSADSEAQGNRTKGKRINELSLLKRGDLLYFDTQTDKAPGHAAIYLGIVNGKRRFIHASSTEKYRCVTVSDFSDWYKDRFMWGIRIWE